MSREPNKIAGAVILLVDDEAEHLRSLERLFHRQGAQIHTAPSGELALDAIRQHPIQLVLSDLMMPGMDGYETMRAIRKMPGFEKLPIIAVTAKAMKGDREKCLEAGASDYVVKPVDTAQLLSLLRVWLYSPDGGGKK